MLDLPDRLMIADGAWGTEIQARGLAGGELPESWNLTRPEAIEALAREYVEAGSDIILTNTFGANRFVLGRYGLADRARQINTAGAALARKAAPRPGVLVFGSIGPTGLLPSVEEVDERSLAEAFEEQAKSLAAGGADGIVIETMSDIVELGAALRAAVATDLPTCACMTFDSGPGKVHTMMGVAVEEAARLAVDEGAAMVGANCGAGIENYREVLARFRAATSLPLWAKPNAGLPEVRSRAIAYAMTPERFVDYARELALAGARVIGGCCGTGPKLVRRLAGALR